MKPLRVLFVCVENSCRSQMAEAFARFHGRGVLEPHSAGSKPLGRINETAVRVLARSGINLSSQRSKGLDEVGAEGWDYVITMGCGDACPFVAAKSREDWLIPDPKSLPYDEFVAVAEEIERRVKGLIASAKARS